MQILEWKYKLEGRKKKCRRRRRIKRREEIREGRSERRQDRKRARKGRGKLNWQENDTAELHTSTGRGQLARWKPSFLCLYRWSLLRQIKYIHHGSL